MPEIPRCIDGSSHHPMAEGRCSQCGIGRHELLEAIGLPEDGEGVPDEGVAE